MNPVLEARGADKINALFSALYGEVAAAEKRYGALIDRFTKRFGSNGEAPRLFSAPGRSEIGGNHTDHNHGRVLAAAVQQDCIGAVRATADSIITISDTTYGEDYSVDISDTAPVAGEKGSRALIRGVAEGFKRAGFKTGGFNGCFSSEIVPASGVSSSAAFEMIICAILNNLYNGGSIPVERFAAFGQLAENVYWNKASGLMDQMASAVGGLVAIDFEDPASPKVEKVPFDFAARHYKLILVNTGGNHANLSEEYSSIPGEMKSAAKALGREVLRGVTLDEFVKKIPALRKSCGDRAVMRAFHFIEEDQRAAREAAALKANDFSLFLRLIRESGNSSWKYLQNVYVPSMCREEQGVSICLALTETFISKNNIEETAACRIHGGGFAGVIQVFLPDEYVEPYAAWMQTALGSADENPMYVMSIRPYGVLEV